MRDVPPPPTLPAPPASPRTHPPGRLSARLPSRLPWELDDPDEPDAEGATPAAEVRDADSELGVADADPVFPADPAALGAASARSSRLRVGVGAAVVLVIVALVCAVLVSMFSGRGRVDVVAPPAAGTSASTAAHPSQPPGEAASTAPPGGAPGDPPLSPSSAGPATPPATPPAGALILLHVLGAVAHPGLYELHAGDRVVDAVAAAGGFTPTADQTQQNLARPLADGEQLVIPEQGAAPPLGSAAAGTTGIPPAGAGAAGTPGGTSGGSAGTAGHPPALVNLNTADQALLETLPEVGPALAQRIIAFRTTNGPFTQLEDLQNVPGIGEKTFAALQPLVTL